MEEWAVCCVNFVSAVNTAWCDDADWWFLVQHCSYLHRGSLCTENDVFCDIECILCIAGWMGFWHIEHFEVVFVKFNFRTCCDGEAHTKEDFFEFVKNKLDWVTFAHFEFAARKSDVDFFFHKLFFQKFGFDFFQFFCKSVFHNFSYFVCQSAHYRSFFGREFAHLFEDGCNFAFFAKHAYADIVNFRRCSCFFNLAEG